jgi:hypothetical protein
MYRSIYTRKALILVLAVSQLVALNSILRVSAEDATDLGTSIGQGTKQVGEDIASGATTGADAVASGVTTGADAVADAAKGFADGVSSASSVEMMLGYLAVATCALFFSS